MSTNDLMLDVGQANEIKLALRRANYTSELVKKLSEGDILAKVKNVLQGYSEIKPIEKIIDLDADPYLLNKDWKIEEHKKGGRFIWNPVEQTKLKYLFLSKKQRNGGVINGNELRKELANKPVLNANVLDWLLKEENQKFIPEDWKGKYIFFWGTIYRDPDGSLNVRYLYWNGDWWSWYWYWLGDGWSECYPAALRASSSV